MNGTLLTEDNLKGIFGSFDIDKTTDTWILEIKLIKGVHVKLKLRQMKLKIY